MSEMEICDPVRHHGSVRPGQLAFVNSDSGRTLTWEQFASRVGRLAGYLRGVGIAAGERVAVLAENNSNFIEIQYACSRLGAIFVPLNWRLTVTELEFIVSDSSPALIIADDTFAGTAAELAVKAGDVPTLAWRTDDGPESAYERAVATSGFHQAKDVSPSDLQMIVYTSGTTGQPKGAKITHGMTLWNTFNMMEYCSLGAGMVNLTVLPLFHVGALNGFANPAVHLGGTSVVSRAFDPAETLAALRSPELGVTHFLGVPTVFKVMAESDAFDGVSFGSLRCALVAGAPVPPSLINTYAAKGVRLQQGFGMTETAGMITCVTWEDALARSGSVGQPVLHIQTRVMRHDGWVAAADETGELWVKGPTVTPGYWRRDTQQSDAFAHGWYRTGDAVRVDAEGYFSIVDRYKDIFISGGENVAPAEVEAVIEELPAVSEVVVVAVADERWGEAGLALIVPSSSQAIDGTYVREHCRERLARYKVPRDVRIVEELPHTATGKVQRSVARRMYA